MWVISNVSNTPDECVPRQRLVRTYSVPPEELAQEARGVIGIAMPILGSTAALVDDISGGPSERTGLLSAALASGLNTNIRDFMAMYAASSTTVSC